MTGEQGYIVRKKTDTELELEILNEDHTLGNLLAKRILEEKGVLMSYYRVEHPLKGGIVLYVKTDGSVAPIEAVKSAVSKILSIIDSTGAEIDAKFKEAKA
jgi:DNA-directed RNA polymerase subunit L